LVAGIILGIGVLAAIFLFQGELKTAFGKLSKTEEEKQAEKQAEKEFKEKGLLGTTQIFLFGTDAENNQAVKEAEKTIEAKKKKQAKDAGFDNVSEFEKETNTNLDILKFNPPGTIGFGFASINEGEGIEDTPENRKVLGVSKNPNQPQTETKIATLSVTQKRQKKPRSVFR